MLFVGQDVFTVHGVRDEEALLLMAARKSRIEASAAERTSGSAGSSSRRGAPLPQLAHAPGQRYSLSDYEVARWLREREEEVETLGKAPGVPLRVTGADGRPRSLCSTQEVVQEELRQWRLHSPGESSRLVRELLDSPGHRDVLECCEGTLTCTRIRPDGVRHLPVRLETEAGTLDAYDPQVGLDLPPEVHSLRLTRQEVGLLQEARERGGEEGRLRCEDYAGTTTPLALVRPQPCGDADVLDYREPIWVVTRITAAGRRLPPAALLAASPRALLAYTLLPVPRGL